MSIIATSSIFLSKLIDFNYSLNIPPHKKPNVVVVGYGWGVKEKHIHLLKKVK